MGEETVFPFLQEHVLGGVDVNETWQPQMIFLQSLFFIGQSMKITLLSSVHPLGYRSLILYLHGMHCFQCRHTKWYQ